MHSPESLRALLEKRRDELYWDINFPPQIKESNGFTACLHLLWPLVETLDKYKTMSCSTNHDMAAQEALNDLAKRLEE